MKLNELQATEGSRQEHYRKGRGIGSGNGKTAGKGHKGQNARSGGGVAIGFEGGQTPYYKSMPKRGFTNFNRKEYAVVNIETLNSIVGIPEGGYTTFSIILQNKKDQLKVANKIENLIRQDGVNVSSRAEAMKNYPTNIDKGITKQFVGDDLMWEGTKYGVETLNDAIPALKTVMSVVHTVANVILLVILLIVMVGVSNTYRMVLYERIREIGTMRALGMDGKNTGKVFTTEAIILCVLGACLGVILAGIFMFVFHLIPIHNETLSLFLHNGHFSFSFSIVSMIMQYLLLIVLTSLAVRGSAKKASKMNPAEALRTVK